MSCDYEVCAVQKSKTGSYWNSWKSRRSDLECRRSSKVALLQ